MKTFNRREVVLGAGVAAGLAGVAGGQSLSAAALPGGGDLPSLRPAEVLRQIGLAGDDERDFLDRLGRAVAPASPVGEARSRPARRVEGQVVASLGLDGQPIALGLRFDCQPRQLNRLTVEGRPLVARRFCYTTDQVRWIPGRGLPPYADSCPRCEEVAGAAYPGAKWHQIVPLIDGQSYFTGCQSADVCESPAAGAVGFDVNARDYDDHAGFYQITIWSWS